MPALRDILRLVQLRARSAGAELSLECLREIEFAIREAYPSERVYISPPNSRKDPARTQAIKAAARRLPTGVVAERHGVSASWVRRVSKK